ncbi:1-aminocyclopropane-1-carboxylate deaminase/D-cysteine desulfhydrase [Chryseolinea soli]|uniref:1-aminocyclopropane-1-carboxylate deaminase/D-cysteine desulfhydrase n=1 Tax=Chryseolinea soli TaxID=2321403 RepID=A0A385T2R6_9BACT|nr:1-aminocyclopropane-1-carboxylate deaminase/D-cysteine desulfhydrase [Chryseolinea soli]
MAYQSTPLVEIHDPAFAEAGIRVMLKREDLNHPYVSGNKWWKLKYNLEKVFQHPSKTLLTFGGAYSNHLYAAAAACHELGFRSIGVVRGEEHPLLNDTLQFAKDRGMQLHYVSRESYRHKTEADFIETLEKEFSSFVLVPEGGSNEEAVQGASEFAASLDPSFDYLCCPVGTGGTLAGLIRGYPPTKTVLGFSALKGAYGMAEEIQRWCPSKTNWQLITDYHFGGYAKFTPDLLQFIVQFKEDHGVPLEPIYTGKMMSGIFDLIKQGFFKRGSTLLAIHTGGLQGKY